MWVKWKWGVERVYQDFNHIIERIMIIVTKNVQQQEKSCFGVVSFILRGKFMSKYIDVTHSHCHLKEELYLSVNSTQSRPWIY